MAFIFHFISLLIIFIHEQPATMNTLYIELFSPCIHRQGPIFVLLTRITFNLLNANIVFKQ